MKRTIKIMALVISLTIAVSCNSHKKSIEEQAQGFLGSYFSLNFEEAAKFCTDSLHDKLIKLKIYESKSSVVDSLVKNKLSNLVFKINNIQREGDFADVQCEISLSDSSSLIVKNLRFEKKESLWKVVSIK